MSHLNMEKRRILKFSAQIEEKIKDYKISLAEIKEEEVKRQLEIVIDDLETILYG